MRSFRFSTALFLALSVGSSPFLPLLTAQKAYAGGGSPTTHQRHYRWRDDLDGLNADSSGWFAGEDLSYSDHPKNTIIRLRVSIDNNGTDISRNNKFSLTWAVKVGGSCGDDESYVAVPGSDTVSTEHFQMDVSGQYASEDATTTNLLTASATTFVNGQGIEDTTIQTGNQSVDVDEYTELEWAIEANSNATDSESYCFRFTVIDTFDVEPELSLAAVGAATVTGTVYTDEGVTPIASGKQVSVAIDGETESGSGTTIAGGQFTAALTGNTLAGGSLLILWLDDQTEDAVTVSRGSGSNMTGVHLYQDRLIVRSNTGSSNDAAAFSNSELNTVEVSGDTDVTGTYTVDSGVLNVKSDRELLVWNGSEFTPRGTVNTGSGVDINGTLTMTGSPLTLSGSFDATGGSFSSSGYVIFDGSSGTHEIISNSNSFYDVFFGPIGGSATFELTDALDIDGNLSISGGTLDVTTGNSAITLSGNWLKVTGETFTAQNGTVTLDGGDQTMSGANTFYGLTKTVSNPQTLTFAATAQQIISNSLTLRGIASNLLSLRSSVTGLAALMRLTTGNTQTIDFLNVQDNDASGGEELDCFTASEGCINSTNNTNWLFVAPVTSNSSWGHLWFPMYSPF